MCKYDILFGSESQGFVGTDEVNELRSIISKFVQSMTSLEVPEVMEMRVCSFTTVEPLSEEEIATIKSGIFDFSDGRRDGGDFIKVLRRR
ncbi:MAG: hypothetical protein GY861_22055 [bacterium]|nr:hypothetical protein [bacterium]